MAIAVDQLLAEISADAPCGEDISYDAGYMEVERMAQGTPETQFQPGEEPNWKEISARCEELTGRSKNLRVILLLTLAEVCLDGVAGLRDGLALLHGVLERYWDQVYPRLDPDDNNDPLERMNIIASLSPPPDAYQDPMRFKDRVLDAPLCESRQLGRYGLRHILTAAGELAVPEGGESPPSRSMIDGAFEDTPLEALQAVGQALGESVAHVKGLDAFLTEKVGAGRAPNLDDFVATLQRAETEVKAQLERRGYGEAGDAAAGATPAAAAAGVPGEINSIQDVLKTLDRICSFYDRHEPSSPVPLLLRRAKRLVGKSFLDIIRDISPSAVQEVTVLSGPEEGADGTGAPASEG
ncbi:MAG: type VI secretion system protein TssA [Kiritimatiellae bacterium]|nr:type VI secretion system protein TssA [Kiritimatiellia bacterium]